MPFRRDPNPAIKRLRWDAGLQTQKASPTIWRSTAAGLGLGKRSLRRPGGLDHRQDCDGSALLRGSVARRRGSGLRPHTGNRWGDSCDRRGRRVSGGRARPGAGTRRDRAAPAPVLAICNIPEATESGSAATRCFRRTDRPWSPSSLRGAVCGTAARSTRISFPANVWSAWSTPSRAAPCASRTIPHTRRGWWSRPRSRRCTSSCTRAAGGPDGRRRARGERHGARR